VDLPVVLGPHVAEGGRDAAFGHDGVGLAEERLADQPTDHALRGASMAARSPAPPAPMTMTSCSWTS